MYDSLAHSPSEVSAPEPRAAFYTYVERIWRSLHTDCRWLDPGGTELQITGYRLAAKDDAPFRPLPPANGVAQCASLAEQAKALFCIVLPVFSRSSTGGIQWYLPDRTSRVLPAPSETGEFVFAWPLPPLSLEGDSGAGHIARLMEGLLDVIELRGADGRCVRPVGVASEGETHAIHYLPPEACRDLGQRKEVPSQVRLQPLHSVIATEPVIVALAWHMALLAQQLRFEDAEGPLQVVGLHARHNEDWVVDSHGHPSEVYEYLARICNVSCKFCYLYGNPDTMAIARGSRVASADELFTRLAHYDPQAGRALFKAQWEINEFLVDPRLELVVTKLRERTRRPFFFITNGSPLTPKVVDLLASVRPVDLVVSVNDIEPKNRAEVMHEAGHQTRTALGALALLRDRSIPFGVSLAAFPQFSLASMERTIRAVEAASASFVRVNLPGYTRSMPADPPFDTDARWREVVDFVRELRPRVGLPVFTIPSAYEENIRSPRSSPCANILGALPGSPAAAANLQPYDVITHVGPYPVESRSELVHLLLLIRRQVELRVLREGRAITLTLDPDEVTSYPYERPVFGKYLFPHGVVAAPSITRSVLAHMARLLEGATHPMVLTSPLMEPEARRLAERYLPEPGRICWVRATNDFLGGNIQVMDMCTVGDLYAALTRAIAMHGRPDRVIVPASGFNVRGRDIVGRHWRELEHSLGVHVRLLDAQSFLF